MALLMPLADITNVHSLQMNKFCDSTPHSCRSFGSVGLSPESPSEDRDVFSHNPYAWKCLPDDAAHAAFILTQRSLSEQLTQIKQVLPTPTPESLTEEKETTSTASSPVCRCLVQFKCHQTEYSSPIHLEKGQYVVVQGDRGMDIGVVVRINTDSSKSYVERTGPSGTVLRHATQREVDYWATDLKADEATALEHCRQRVVRQQLPMEVRHAEYQFDKKKLTFYYESKVRVEFVGLLKELYREFGCRIWMEKVRGHE